MHQRSLRLIGLLVVLTAGLFLGASRQARAVDRDRDDDNQQGPQFVVDDDRQQCRNAQFTRIQDAVNAAPSGATITVCAGTYVEQVTVPAGKNGLTIRAAQPLAAVIKAPPLMVDPKAIVHVDGARDVTLRGFKITGPGGGPCDSLRYGVLVDKHGSALVRDNYITNIRDTPFGGCQNGVGVQVGSLNGVNNSALPGEATIVNNTIDRYQKNGITVNEIGSRAVVTDNEVTGRGPTSVIAQNGIQIGFGADAQVARNEVADNIYTPQTFSSVGILLIEPGHVAVEQNEVRRSDVGIWALAATNPTIARNLTTNNTYDGLDLTDGTTGAQVTHNTSLNNGLDGIFVDATATNNTISHNKLRGNGLFDAEDLSVGTRSCNTANTWTHNNCQTDNHGGCLCANHGGGDDDDGAGAGHNEANVAARPQTPAQGGASGHRPQPNR